jgi:hypothetical protein
MKCRRCNKNKPYNGDWYDGMCPECADATEPKEVIIKQRKEKKSKSAMFCQHANENPAQCHCESDCYCRVNGTCRKELKRKKTPKAGLCEQPQVFIQVLGGVVQSIHVYGKSPKFFVLDFDNEDEARCENLTKAEVLANRLIKTKIFNPKDWGNEDDFVKRFE